MELDSHKTTGTYEAAILPSGRNPVGVKWMLSAGGRIEPTGASSVNFIKVKPLSQRWLSGLSFIKRAAYVGEHLVPYNTQYVTPRWSNFATILFLNSGEGVNAERCACGNSSTKYLRRPHLFSLLAPLSLENISLVSRCLTRPNSCGDIERK